MTAPVRVPKPARARPNATPMRLTLGATGLVAAAALMTAILQSQVGVAQPKAAIDDPAITPPPIVIRQVTRDVQLKPGETAPPGARVVQRPAASPRVVTITVPVPTRRPTVVVTRQSGT